MRKLSFQKIFCFISFLFIMSCCIFYGVRFLKLYLENQKIEVIEKNSLVKVIKENNESKENFEYLNNKYYFTNDTENNYLKYSNILWRIMKINSDNSITLISDNSITNLAYGKNVNFDESYINKWLNISDLEYSGILEKVLNKKEEYLVTTNTCLDIVDEFNNNDCQNIYQDSYISLLNTIDYVNIGNKLSYVINGENFYLSNINSDSQIWYITSEGTLSTSIGTDLIGVRPVITIKPNIDYISGDGTSNNPYLIEEEFGLFGSYVKLDNDLWQIYQVDDDVVRLSLNDYIKVNDEYFTYQYSYLNSYHDDYKNGSIAYYLNNNYLNSLSYKDIIKEVNWTNGYYTSANGFDYTTSLSKDTMVNSKVALMSVGDIFLNNNLENYYMMTGTSDKGSMVYVINKKKLMTKHISQKLNIVPTISIDKTLLVKGSGTFDDPYEME